MKTNSSTSEVEFETALRSINLSTWNRQRSDTEIRSFLTRRQAVVEAVEL